MIYYKSRELTKEDNQMAKGLAIVGMVLLHLFCRLGELPYTPLLYIGEIPMIYYIGLFGDLCVPIYCFCSGYAHYLLKEKYEENYHRIIRRKIFSFLKNFWLVLIVFTILGLIFDKTNSIPGNVEVFMGNFFLYNLSYNGAWWFVLTYIILTITSPIIINGINYIHPCLIVIISGAVYFAAYVFRFIYVLSIDVPIVEWLWTQAILFGTSQFGYIIGMIFRKHCIIEYLKMKLDKKSFLRRSTVCIVPIILFLFHCKVESAIVAPITGLGTLICFYLWDKVEWVQKVFMFFGKHSTNIWLIHMFFYATLYTDFIFAPQYPFLIFGLMMVVCVVFSCLIQYLLKIIS